ncbi:MAG: hypothetical protein JSS74_11955 [Actinobacteria bacterium]|nr:hypothetical protein [Actinomycetota bacterium]
MSWFSKLLFGAPATAHNVLSPLPVLPYAPAPELQALVYKDIYGGAADDAVTREVAMTVSPVKKARAVIIGRLSDLPIEQGTTNAAGEFVADTTQPGWLTDTGTVQTVWHRTAWTLDDLMFTGWALWALDRTGDTITSAARVPRTRWTFADESPTGIAVNGTPVTDPDAVLLICGPDEGLLVTARDAIRGWRHMEKAWVGRARNPIPLIVLHEVQDNGVTESEAKAYVSAWSAARTSENGAVGFLPASLALEVHGDVEADLFDKGRNAARIDIANQTNLPVSYLDGSTATSSLTYVTQEGSRNQVIDDLEYWLAPFEHALTTLTPGKKIRVNRSNLTAVPNDTFGPTTRTDTTTTQEVPA